LHLEASRKPVRFGNGSPARLRSLHSEPGSQHPRFGLRAACSSESVAFKHAFKHNPRAGLVDGRSLSRPAAARNHFDGVFRWSGGASQKYHQGQGAGKSRAGVSPASLLPAPNAARRMRRLSHGSRRRAHRAGETPTLLLKAASSLVVLARSALRPCQTGQRHPTLGTWAAEHS